MARGLDFTKKYYNVKNQQIIDFFLNYVRSILYGGMMMMYTELKNLKTFKNFFYFWPCWVFIAAGFSLVVARVSHCSGFSCCRAQILGSTGSIVVMHGLSCSMVCGIFPGQG